MKYIQTKYELAKFKCDKELLLLEEEYILLLKNNDISLFKIPEQLRTETICLEAVKQYGNAKNYGNALYWVPKELKDKIKSALKLK